VPSTGTVNAIYRLGDQLYARLPRLQAWAGDLDSDAAVAAWEGALQAPAWTGAPEWVHCDLLRPNLLVRTGGCARSSTSAAPGSVIQPPT
jgi:hypothetical protein